jgi:hypothetical protein
LVFEVCIGKGEEDKNELRLPQGVDRADHTEAIRTSENQPISPKNTQN